jgi:DNA modification methylase
MPTPRKPRKTAAPEAALPSEYSIDFRDAASLVPYARNTRTHSDEQVAKIMASIVEFGFTKPVLIDGDGIVAGHGTTQAALRLYEQGRTLRSPGGFEIPAGKVPTLDCSGWSAAQRKAYIIADNAIAEQAGWDRDLLRIEIDDLKSEDFNIDLLGFDPDGLAALLGNPVNEGLTDPDEAPPLPVDPVSVLGDVWVMGRHRLVCGDSTDADTVAKCLNGVVPNLMVTDPPYGVNYDPSWRKEAGMGSGDTATGKVLNDDRADWREAWALFPGSVAYVWHGGLHSATVVESLQACKFDIRAQIIWVKTRPALSRGNYHWQHEPAYYGVKDAAEDGWRFIPEHEVAGYAIKKGQTADWKGGRKQSTVWFIEHLKSDTGHGTQKPVDCMKRPMENNSNPGQAVYEPFSGSGTTIIAGEICERAVHAIELSPAYVDVGVNRWQNFTGQKAVLEGDGRTFDEVKAGRL